MFGVSPLQCMSALRKHDTGQFDYADYLSLQLIKLGIVNPKTLSVIQTRFVEMDTNQSGTLTREQLLLEHAFDSIDTSNLGVIDLAEFAQLCTYLAGTGNAYFKNVVKSDANFRREFDSIPRDDKDAIKV